MPSYPFEEFTRVAIATSLANPDAPTSVELYDAIDITCDLTKDGLKLPKTTEAISRARWHNQLLAEDPGRYSVAGAQLTGKRRTQGDSEPLWDAAIYRSTGYLIVRRGIRYSYSWDDGQVVEVLGIGFGIRDNAPSAANITVTFTVPLFVSSFTDSAVVHGGVVLHEDGRPILTEDGLPILMETA